MKEDDLNKQLNKELKNEIDSIPVNTDLLERIKAENPTKKVLFPLWFQSSFWKYGVGISALLFAFLYITKPTATKELIVFREVPSEIIVDTVFIKDTIYVEQKIPESNLLVSRPNNPKTKKYTKKRGNELTQSRFVFEEQYFDKEQLENQQKSVGTSSNESGELTQFLGVNI